jgi:hypothetical protein
MLSHSSVVHGSDGSYIDDGPTSRIGRAPSATRDRRVGEMTPDYLKEDKPR